MLPTPADCIHIMRRAAADHDDAQPVTVPAGALRAAVLALEDHAHCETDGDEGLADLQKQHDEGLADLQKQHDAEMAQLEAAAAEVVAAVEAMLKIAYDRVDDALTGLKGML